MELYHWRYREKMRPHRVTGLCLCYVLAENVAGLVTAIKTPTQKKRKPSSHCFSTKMESLRAGAVRIVCLVVCMQPLKKTLIMFSVENPLSVFSRPWDPTMTRCSLSSWLYLKWALGSLGSLKAAKASEELKVVQLCPEVTLLPAMWRRPGYRKREGRGWQTREK